MKKIYTLLFFILSVIIINQSCSKGGGSTPAPPSGPCSTNPITISGTVTNTSAPGQANGAINVSATGGTSIQYSINGAAFQASGNFASLAANTYTISVKNAEGCTASQPFTVADGDPCTGKTIVISLSPTGSDKCSPTGTVTATVTGSTGFTYSKDNITYQASNIFSGLNAANYTIFAKDASGCVKSNTTTVSQLPAGLKFTAVKGVMNASCAITGCHVPPAPTGGLNFQDDCTIVSSWDRIKARAVDGNPSFMPPPPSPQLSNADKQKILDWIAAGHRYID